MSENTPLLRLNLSGKFKTATLSLKQFLIGYNNTIVEIILNRYNDNINFLKLQIDREMSPIKFLETV